MLKPRSASGMSGEDQETVASAGKYADNHPEEIPSTQRGFGAMIAGLEWGEGGVVLVRLNLGAYEHAHRPFGKLVHRPGNWNVAMGTTWALSYWAHGWIILESMLGIQACKVLSRKT